MSEQTHHYEGNDPCPLAGHGCCRDKHRAEVKARIEQGTKRTGEETFSWEPVPNKLGNNETLFGYPLFGIWLTALVYNHDKMKQLEKEALPDRKKFTHWMDVASTKTTVHTATIPDCPLLKLLREHKI